jgi:hypothetical protein
MLGALVVCNVASTIASGSKVFDAQMVGIPTAWLMLDGLTGGGVPCTTERRSASRGP